MMVDRRKWNAEDYVRHSRGQLPWARELISGLALRNDEAVLDPGCVHVRTARHEVEAYVS